MAATIEPLPFIFELMNHQLHHRRDLTPQARALLPRIDDCLARGALLPAKEGLREALRLVPDHPELLRRQALILHIEGSFAEAVAMWQRVLVAYPDDAVVHNSLGSARGAAGDMLGAVLALRRACELAPDRAGYWFNLAKAHEGIENSEEACAALTQVLELDPTDHQARISRARALTTLGDLDRAADELRRVIAKVPDSIEAWTALVNLKSVQLTDQDLAQMKRVQTRSNAATTHRISMDFAYGAALESKGHYAEAFSVIAATNAAKRRTFQWEASATSQFVDEVMKSFARPITQAADPTLGHEAIFLVGMLRSGSTLAEQILCAHPQVAAAGEINDLSMVLLEESRRRGADVAAWAPSAMPADWTRLGQTYMERTARWRRSGGYFTDKELAKWQTLGVVRAMLPGAHFIHCRRDPLETCWSCFKHEFARGELYSYDMNELATYWRDCDRMMRFWHTQYPGLIYDHAYESLLEQPEVQIRRLLGHCGLPFDPACMRFHEIRRSVRTASAGQVRQPLKRGPSVAACYGKLLDPLRRALAAGCTLERESGGARSAATLDPDLIKRAGV